jgi:hypothetical protein
LAKTGRSQDFFNRLMDKQNAPHPHNGLYPGMKEMIYEDTKQCG